MREGPFLCQSPPSALSLHPALHHQEAPEGEHQGRKEARDTVSGGSYKGLQEVTSLPPPEEQIENPVFPNDQQTPERKLKVTTLN